MGVVLFSRLSCEGGRNFVGAKIDLEIDLFILSVKGIQQTYQQLKSLVIRILSVTFDKDFKSFPPTILCLHILI